MCFLWFAWMPQRCCDRGEATASRRTPCGAAPHHPSASQREGLGGVAGDPTAEAAGHGGCDAEDAKGRRGGDSTWSLDFFSGMIPWTLVRMIN